MPDMTAFHEAGHAVAAIALGTPIKRASLDRVTTLVRPGCPQAQRNEAIIALAGPAAEAKFRAFIDADDTRSCGAASGRPTGTTHCATSQAAISIWRCTRRASWCARTGTWSNGWRRPCSNGSSFPVARSPR